MENIYIEQINAQKVFFRFHILFIPKIPSSVVTLVLPEGFWELGNEDYKSYLQSIY
jgi:hypothetical protein